MNDLREHWDEFTVRFMPACGACILADLDGTLVPLAEHPEAVEVPAATRHLLSALAALPRFSAGVVSGRSLEDLTARVGVRGLWYVGNHGFEMRTPAGEDRLFYDPRDVSFLEMAAREMLQETSPVRGVFVEHKGPILAVHYRQVDPALKPRVEQAFLEIAGRHHKRLMVSKGNQVLEVRLRSSCNKGRAVSMIRRETPPGTLAVYFGDDLTDRDAFRELRGVGVSVEVGGKDSHLADFTLPGPEAVGEVLRRILAMVDAKPRRTSTRRLARIRKREKR